MNIPKMKLGFLALVAGSTLATFAAGEVFVLRHKGYGKNRDGMANNDYANMAVADYNTSSKLYSDFAFMAKGAEGHNATWLKQSQNRVDGWFYVPAEKAGAWTLHQSFDDYMSIAIDGVWVLHNKTYTTDVTSQTQVTEGWHWLTVVYGDTYGGYGPHWNWPFTVAVNGGGAVDFNSTNFKCADPTADTNGTFAIPLTGTMEFATMNVGANCRLLIDPETQHPHLMQRPTFAAGAKIALPASYADHANGTIDLLTWDTGGVPGAAELNGVIDTTGMNWPYAEIQAVPNGNGGKLQLLISNLRPSVLFRHRRYGQSRDGMADSAWKDLRLTEYSTYTATFTDLAFMNKDGMGMNATYLATSQNRVSGWFCVSADKAGDWRIDQGFDDYMAFAIDNEWVIQNPTYTDPATANKTVTAGWHTFVIVYGDTYGGYGAYGNAPFPNDFPLAFTVGGTKYKFNQDNLTFQDPTATYNGTLALGVPGLVDMATMDVGSTCRLEFDPQVSDLHLWQSPSFAAGAKLALSANYADAGRARIRLMTWEQGMPDAASLEGLLDTTGMNWTDAQLEAVAVGKGGELWARLNGVDASVVFRHVQHPSEMSPKYGYDYETMPINAYTYTQKLDNPDVIENGRSTYLHDVDWAYKYRRISDNRLDGWVYVTAEQAGEWTVRQRDDDFMSFAIDGVWIIHNNTHMVGQERQVTVAAGWHAFTIIFGDTNGGYGPDYADYDYYPLHILKDGVDLKFNSKNFRFDSPFANLSGDFNVTVPGTVHFATLALDADDRVVFDPVRTSLWSVDAPSFAEGAKFAFAAGAPTEGRFLVMTWEQGGTGFDASACFDAASTAAAVAFSVVPYGAGGQLWATLNGDAYVATATWTGAIDSDCTKAGNWDCVNANGETVTGVPGAQTKVLVSGNVNLQIPTSANFRCKEFAIAGATTLAADCDWRGLGDTPIIADGGEELAYGVRALTGVEVDNGTVFGTEYKPNHRTKLVMDLTVKGTTEYWFGVWDVGYNNGAFCAGNDGNGIYLGYGNQGGTYQPMVAAGRHVIELSASAFNVDGTLHHSFNANEFQLANALTLGAQNRTGYRWTIYGGGTWAVNGSQNAFTLHSCQIYEDGELVHDFRAARCQGDGGVGLYDVRQQKFNRPMDIIPAYAESVQTLDLAGHRLQLGGAIARKDAALTITDSSSDAAKPGQLELEIAEGQTFVNDGQLYLTGNLKLVTTGAGEFVAVRRNQVYTGGTRVAGGTMGTRVAYNADLDKYYAKRGFWGAQHSNIEVGSGGTFDLKGNYDYQNYDFVLDGGTLANSGPAMTHTNWGGLGNLSLTADSALRVGVVTIVNNGNAGATFDLGGYTLTATMGEGSYFKFCGKTTIRNGTLACERVTANGFLQVLSGQNVDASAASLKLNVRYEPYGTMTVGNLLYQDSQSASNWDWGQAITTVVGTFKPETVLFHNTKLENGATLDLTGWEGVFDVKSGFVPNASAQQFLTFADGSQIRVDLTGRQIVSDTKVISWNAEEPPANLDTLSFRLTGTRTGTLVKRADGVYYQCGFMIYVR